MSARQTPVPWRRDGSAVAPSLLPGIAEATVYIVGGSDGEHPTIFVSSNVKTKKDRAQLEANVAFILRACNSHEALLEAIKDLLEQLRKGGFLNEHGSAMELWDMEAVHAAIAKAEGRS